ncbi:DUF2116 family Zn-ribbon domain-containing protein [Patescibacteria group bacterium]|nr:DUF2116 family Zn-ribbon domain-containing protein [Patescibacteria group bacterium]
MKDCPACGEKIKDDALKCKFCGVDLNLRKCPWCAELIEKNAKKCRHCKTFLTKIHCDGCGDAVEISEMRCGNCVEKMVETESRRKLEERQRQMGLLGWLILIAVVVFGSLILSRIF